MNLSCCDNFWPFYIEMVKNGIVKTEKGVGGGGNLK